MERAGQRRLPLLVAAVVASAVAAGAGVVVAQGGDDRPPARDKALSDHLPVVDYGGSVAYEDVVVRGEERTVISVGTSVGSLVVTIAPEDDDLNEVVIHDGADELASYDDVRGLAIADPGGTLSAWVEVEETATAVTETVVAVDTSTGKELGRLPVSGYANVTAVRGEEVAISDGDSSRLWAPGSPPRPLRFVPDDHTVVGFTDTRVIAADQDFVTTIHDRGSGAEVATFTDLQQWDTNVAGDLLVGATADGGVRQVDLATGESTLIDTIVEAGIASFGEDDTVLVLDADAFAEADAVLTIDICPQGGACASVTSRTVPLYPNDIIGQLGSQSS